MDVIGYFHLSESHYAELVAGQQYCEVDRLPMYIGKKDDKRTVYYCTAHHPNRSKEVSNDVTYPAPQATKSSAGL